MDEDAKTNPTPMIDTDVAKEMAKPVQKPSVGRIVHYSPPDEVADRKQPRAAVITHVWSETCINLYVFPDGSYPLDDINPTSVTLGTGPRTWCWPPRV